MAVQTRVAKRYAWALLDVAHERGTSQRCLQDLQSFQRIVEQCPDLAEVVQNPTIPALTVAKVVAQVGRALKLHDTTIAFLQLLAERRRLPLLGQVLEAYVEERERRASRATGMLVSAVPVTEPQVTKIRAALGAVLNVRQVVLKMSLDESLLSGFRVVVGDKVFDMTASTYLEAVRTQLLRSR